MKAGTFFDVNVIVGELLFNDSVPGQAFFRALDRGVLLLSPLWRQDGTTSGYFTQRREGAKHFRED